jgi:hypothetical protein
MFIIAASSNSTFCGHSLLFALPGELVWQRLCHLHLPQSKSLSSTHLLYYGKFVLIYGYRKDNSVLKSDFTASESEKAASLISSSAGISPFISLVIVACSIAYKYDLIATEKATSFLNWLIFNGGFYCSSICQNYFAGLRFLYLP